MSDDGGAPAPDLPPILDPARRRHLAVLIANGLVQAGLLVWTAILARRAFDHLNEGYDWQRLRLHALGLVAAGLGTWLLRVRERSDAERLAQDYVKAVRLRLFDHLNRVPLRSLQRRTTGVLMVRFVADLNALGAWAGRGVARLVVAGPVALGAGAALVWTAPSIGGAVGAVVALAAAAVMLSGPALYARTREVRRRRGNLAANLGDKIGAGSATQVFGRARGERNRLAGQSDKLAAAAVQGAGFSAAMRALPDAVMPMATALTLLVAAGWYEGEAGPGTAGSVAAVLLLLGLLATPLRDLSRVFVYWQNFRAARDVLRRFLALPALESQRRFEPGPGRIVFEGVSVAGSLENLTLIAEPGQRIAVVGPGGAGKTTLLNLAGRLIDPDEGRVLIDDQDLAGCEPASVRRSVGSVSPDLGLIRASLGRNLRYRDADADEGAVAAILKACELTEAVAAMEEGLETRLAEGGAGLPTGLRQRIALARAFLGNPPIVLLDEPDAIRERTARTVLRRLLRRNRATVLMATHTLAMARQADVVWHLEEGRLVAAGPPDAVLAAGSPTARFFDGEAGEDLPAVSPGPSRPRLRAPSPGEVDEDEDEGPDPDGAGPRRLAPGRAG